MADSGKTEKSGEYEFRLVGHGDEWSDASSVECVPKLLTITVQQLCKPLYSVLCGYHSGFSMEQIRLLNRMLFIHTQIRR